MLIILAARAVSKDVLSGLSTVWEQNDRGFGEGNNVLTMVLASCTGNGPNSFIEINFGPAHATDFVPALARQRE